MKLHSILAIIFIAILSFATITEAATSRSSSSSSRSSSSSSKSSSSSYSKSYSNSSSKPSTSTSTYTKTYTSTPTTTATTKPAATSTYTKTYTSTPTTTPTSTKSTSYGGTTSTTKQTIPNPNFTPPTRQTATNTTVINNRTVVYSQGVGGNGSTFMDSIIGTMAGMAIYDMITDDKGNQVKVEPYYVSGEQRIPVGTGAVTPKTVTQPIDTQTAQDESDAKTILLWIAGIIALGVCFMAFVYHSNSY